MMVFLNILLFIVLAFLAFVLVSVIFISVTSLFVNTKKEYLHNNKFFRAVLNYGTFWGLFFAGVKLHVTGLEKVPSDTRFLFVSNHRSNFDPIVSWHALRKFNLSFLSKRENFKLYAFGRIIRKCCFLPIDRENPRNALATLIKAADLMKNDEVSIGIYPEGTRNKSYVGLLDFHNGIFKCAKMAKVPIVVAVIQGTENIHKNFPFRRPDVYLDFIDVISVDEVVNSRSQNIGEKVYAMMKDNLSQNIQLKEGE